MLYPNVMKNASQLRMTYFFNRYFGVAKANSFYGRSERLKRKNKTGSASILRKRGVLCMISTNKPKLAVVYAGEIYNSNCQRLEMATFSFFKWVKFARTDKSCSSSL